MYMMAKHLHLTLIAISVLFFITRYIWVMIDSGMMQKRWVKVVPHVVDTFLLLSAITLCVILAQYPFQAGWVTEKLIGLILYIFFGLVVLKIGKDKKIKTLGFVLALSTIALMGKIAITKQGILF